jgi:hypothetical protein
MWEKTSVVEVGLLRLRRLVRIGSERADVNQPNDSIVGSGAGDDRPVGVANQDNGAVDPADRFFRHLDVLCRRVEAVLCRNTLIALRLQGNDQLAEARAIGPEPVAEHDGRCDPTSTSPIASMARLSFSQTSINFEKSWPKALWQGLHDRGQSRFRSL